MAPSSSQTMPDMKPPLGDRSDDQPRPLRPPGFGWAWIALLAALGAAGWFAAERLLVDRRPITVGILHSLSGPMAISERSMVDAEVLALEELNREGGLLGRPIRWVVADGASDWPTFAAQARRLIRDERADVLVGCWTSASRKTVVPVVEEADHLLVYPMAYEGLEQSPNVIYVGAAPNQQIIPAVQWTHDVLAARRYVLVGSDYIWPHCVNTIVSDQLVGLGAEKVAELYVPFGSTAVDAVVAKIAAEKPDVVLSTVVGDSAVAFFRKLREAGVRPQEVPVVSFSIAENELRSMAAEDVAGHYAAWCYFQSIERPENLAFVRSFKARYGNDRVTSDVIAAAYTGVRLWAQAVREAGTSEVRQVRAAMRHQSMDAPEGVVAVDPETQHTWRPVSIGRVKPDGQFDLVWNSRTAVRPVPFPITRSRAEWLAFVDDLFVTWGRSWSNPVGAVRTGRPSEGRLP